MTKSNQYNWPKGSRLSFYNGKGELQLRFKRRSVDFSDELMLNWGPGQRTIYFGLRLAQGDEWSDKLVEECEWRIRYDLNFDGYSVRIVRLSQVSVNFPEEYLWRLVIRTRGYVALKTRSGK